MACAGFFKIDINAFVLQVLKNQAYLNASISTHVIQILAKTERHALTASVNTPVNVSQAILVQIVKKKSTNVTRILVKMVQHALKFLMEFI